MSLLRHVTATVLLGLSVAACSSAPPMPHYTPVSFANEPTFTFNVMRVEVVNQYRSPGVRPHIEGDMPVSPEAGIRQWAQDRLKATGTTGVLRVLIKDAAATETPLKKDQSFAANFKNEEAARIDMSLDVSLQILDERQFVQYEVTQRNNISQTELDDLKLNDRDKLLYDTVTEMTKSFDRGIDQSIRTTLASQLVIP